MITIMEKYVAYYRVSTQRQGQSGLGLEAQEEIVKRFVRCDDCIIGDFVEIESGSKNNRVELGKALDYCKQTGAILIVAKLDRLSREVEFIARLMNTGVKFRCCDIPDANELTIHIFAAFAEHERKRISERTKAALAVKKAQLAKQGKKLGNPRNFSNKERRKAVATRKHKAQENENTKQASSYAKLLAHNRPTITTREIAATMNERGFKAPRGGKITAMGVKRLLDMETI